jgi:hypothetical protein
MEHPELRSDEQPLSLPSEIHGYLLEKQKKKNTRKLAIRLKNLRSKMSKKSRRRPLKNLFLPTSMTSPMFSPKMA